MDSPASQRAVGARLQAMLLVAAMILGSAMLWIGFPLGWLWIGSQVTDSSQPSLTPYLVVVVGLAVSIIVDYKVLVRLDNRHARLTGVIRGEIAPRWTRSLRDGRGQRTAPSVLDRVMVATVALAFCSFVVWFFAFAGGPGPG